MRQRLSSNALVYLPIETSSASAEGTLAAENLVGEASTQMEIIARHAR